ncbi:MAG TPA: ABC transporter substrate-binding protein [Bacteroidales bacterium]
MKTFFCSQGMNQIRILSLTALCLVGLVSCENDEETKGGDGEKVVLTLASWRTEDVAQMNRINALFTQEHPNITIQFEPVVPEVYDSVTLSNFADGKGADIVLLRSYDKGSTLYNQGYLYDLTDVIPNLDAFNPTYVDAWSSNDGVTYGVPSVGVTQGIYYNKAIFAQYNLTEPATWDQLMTICETLRTAGITPFAQGGADTWTLYENIYAGLGANFYGGELGRQALMEGTETVTNPDFVDAFVMLDSLTTYFPDNYIDMEYVDLRAKFAEGDYAMFISGSWEIAVLEQMGADSTKIGWFAAPVKNEGDKLQYIYHVDAGIGVNKDTKHLEAALEYIKWVSGTEYAENIMKELPGFFSYTPGVTVTPTNPLAKEMYSLIATSDLTVRTMCQDLSTSTGSGDALMGEVLRDMLKGTYTPQQAANYVESQLETKTTSRFGYSLK